MRAVCGPGDSYAQGSVYSARRNIAPLRCRRPSAACMGAARSAPPASIELLRISHNRGHPIKCAGDTVMVQRRIPRETNGVIAKSRTGQQRGVAAMPLFMDVHTMDGPVGLSDVAKAHQADLDTQGEYQVNYLRYWV